MALYLDRTRLAALPNNYVPAPGDWPMASMLNDGPKRYFHNEAELIGYARKKTETIGYVAKAKAWIRIDELNLLVLGESHDKTRLTDIADALGTGRWRYEGRFELPDWLSAVERDQAELAPWQLKVWRQLADIQKSASGHAGESFLPALWRGVAAFDFRDDDPALAAVLVQAPEPWLLLYWLVFAASVAAKGFSELHSVYMSYRQVLEPFLYANVSAAMDLPPERRPLDVGVRWAVAQTQTEPGAKAFKASITALRDALKVEVAGEQKKQLAAEPVPGLFAQHWRQATARRPESDKEYEDPLIVEADKARDFSMYLNILAAARSQSLLFGLGGLHLDRLEPLLEEVPRHVSYHQRIRYEYLPDFIERQLKAYPQG